MLEVRWHGRGGQGVVTAGRLVAAAALKAGYNVQSFPEFGPERAGAPVRAYNRIAKKKIRAHFQITNPKYVIVLDPTLIGNPQILEGTSEETIFIVNYPEERAKELREHLRRGEVYYVDATRISLEVLGRNIPNTPLVAAFLKVSGLVYLETLKEVVKEWFEERISPEVAEKNVKLVEKVWEEVKKLDRAQVLEDSSDGRNTSRRNFGLL